MKKLLLRTITFAVTAALVSSSAVFVSADELTEKGQIEEESTYIVEEPEPDIYTDDPEAEVYTDEADAEVPDADDSAEVPDAEVPGSDDSAEVPDAEVPGADDTADESEPEDYINESETDTYIDEPVNKDVPSEYLIEDEDGFLPENADQTGPAEDELLIEEEKPDTYIQVEDGSASIKDSGIIEEVAGWDNTGEETVSGDWKYTYYGEYTDDDQKVSRLYIIAYLGNEEDITIPDVIDGKRVYGVSGENSGSSSWNVKSITFSAGIKRISGFAFEKCKTLETITFAKGSQLFEIANYGFYRCENLKSIVLPDSLLKVEQNAFDGCYALTDITLGKNIGPFIAHENLSAGDEHYEYDYAFNPAPRSRGVVWHVPSDSLNFKLVNGVLFSKDGSILYSRPAGAAGASYSVPNGVKEIAEYAFCFDENLTAVTFPNSLRTIGEGAFNTTGVVEAVIPDSVDWLGSDAFCYCESLRKVKLGRGITSLYKEGSREQFYGCKALSEVSLPDTLEVIGNMSFAYCDSLKEIHLPDSLKQINYGGFGECKNLTRVTGGKGLERIYNRAFLRCAVSDFPFGNNLKYVGGSAFLLNTGTTADHPSYLTAGSDLDGDGYNDYYVALTGFSVTGEENYTMAFQVLDLVNKERASQGLSALTMDQELLDAAMQRAAELVARFSHTRPNGSDCFSISKKAFAENIALGQSSADSVMNSWMNSAGHRANILTGGRKSIGVGCFVNNGICYWVQLFGDEVTSAAKKKSNVNAKHNIELLEDEYLPKAVIYDGDWEDSSTVSVNEKVTLKVYVYDSDSPYFSGVADPEGFTWTSSNASVAKVDKKGVITPLKEGTAVITASFAGTELKAQYTVKVKKSSAEPAKTVAVKSVKLNKKTATLNVGKKLTLKATVSPSKATNKAVTWKSSNKKIATVSKTGKVTAKKPGKVTITVTTKDGKKKATCKITVKAPLKGIKLSKKTAKIKKGKTLQLKVTYNPTNTTSSKKVTWTSSNKKIATVSKTGKIKAKKKGTVTIKAKVGKYTVSCKVKVI